MKPTLQQLYFRSAALLFLCFAAAITTLTGCDLFGGADTGTVRVELTDAPFPFALVDSANVSVERVELVREGNGIVDVTEDWTEAQEFNLLTLRDSVTALLGEVEVEEGTYSQIRIVVGEEASVVMNESAGGDKYPLKVPSGTETGIKIPLHQLVVEGGSYLTITLDFDVSESFVVLGTAETPEDINGFNFKPVVKLLSVEQTPAE